MSKLLKVAITLGDPSGIGPEVSLKAIASPEIANLCTPVIIGSQRLLDKALGLLALKPSKFEFINAFDDSDIEYEVAKPDIQSAHASVSFIKKAVQMALAKEVSAIVTAPITKEALKLAGYKWHGHTEMLAELTNSADFAMMFYSEPLKVILVTIHEPIKALPSLITKDKVLKTIRLAHQAMQGFGIKKPKVAVCGLNPHAGESGLFSDEEILHISPAIKEANAEGIEASGPFAADTLFYKVIKGSHDIVVSMYHDQGLIPLKSLAFDTAVNVTVGLPIIRTSPDHGTAYDIAYKGTANPSSMIEAIKVAVKLACSRD